METICVEIYTDQGNNAVIRLPERRKPGVLMQGDTLKNLVMMADSVRSLAESGPEDLKGEAELLADTLRDIYAWYEFAIQNSEGRA